MVTEIADTLAAAADAVGADTGRESRTAPNSRGGGGRRRLRRVSARYSQFYWRKEESRMRRRFRVGSLTAEVVFHQECKNHVRKPHPPGVLHTLA